ncbi:MAG: radical SAM protein [Deltaproteobacteria bacterium]|nr:radical SAM protein [Deltaproteobacteria bacterium]
MKSIDHRRVYRLPWSLPDNPVAWLEPTSQCNLSCEGCYRENVKDGHLALDEIERHLDIFQRDRNPDGISIAGGDPLTHPQIVEIVTAVARRGLKPILNTNGVKLEEPLLRELRRVGLKAVTFHIDSKQGRKGWRGKNEIELCALREQLARTVAKVGGITCSFNQTVYPDTLDQVPDVVRWAADNIDIVQVVVFILYRSARLDGPFHYFAGGKNVDMQVVPYITEGTKAVYKDLKADDVIAKIREADPLYAPAGYLNGTEDPTSFKWTLAARFGQRGKSYGYVGPRFMEVGQAGHHLLTGRYMGYSPRWIQRMGLPLLAAAPIEPGLKGIAKRFARDVVRNPFVLTKGLHVQAFMIIQPIDVLPDGRQSMCDSCPDMTVYDGRLVWSCRMEELRCFGTFVQTVPRPDATTKKKAARPEPTIRARGTLPTPTDA